MTTITKYLIALALLVAGTTGGYLYGEYRGGQIAVTKQLKTTVTDVVKESDRFTAVVAKVANAFADYSKAAAARGDFFDTARRNLPTHHSTACAVAQEPINETPANAAVGADPIFDAIELRFYNSGNSLREAEGLRAGGVSPKVSSGSP